MQADHPEEQARLALLEEIKDMQLASLYSLTQDQLQEQIQSLRVMDQEVRWTF